MVTFDRRRRFPRVPFYVPVGVLMEGRYRVVFGYELGEGGMSIQTQDPVPLAQRILLTIPSAKMHFYCVQAEVRNCLTQPDGTFHIGTQFIEVSFEVKRDIRSFVSTARES